MPRIPRIPLEAFADCTELKVIAIPDSVTTIADDALPSEVIIVCSGDSFAKQYAVAHGMLYYCEE